MDFLRLVSRGEAFIGIWVREAIHLFSRSRSWSMSWLVHQRQYIHSSRLPGNDQARRTQHCDADSKSSANIVQSTRLSSMYDWSGPSFSSSQTLVGKVYMASRLESIHCCKLSGMSDDTYTCDMCWSKNDFVCFYFVQYVAHAFWQNCNAQRSDDAGIISFCVGMFFVLIRSSNLRASSGVRDTAGSLTDSIDPRSSGCQTRNTDIISSG